MTARHIITSTLPVFLSSLEMARKSRPVVVENTADCGEIAVQISRAFWAGTADDRPDYQDMVAGRRPRRPVSNAHATAIATFYRERCIVRTVYEDNKAVAGYVVLDGELCGLHSHVKGLGDWLMRHAIADGAVRLNSFSTAHLRALYERHGFLITRTEQNMEPGGRHVVYRERTYAKAS